MDMAADHPVDPAFSGGAGNDLLIAGDEFDRVLDLVLGHLAERPIGQIEPVADRIDPAIEPHQQMIGGIAHEGEPAVRQHDRVEFIAMQHHQAAPVSRGVERGPADFDPAEIQARELAEHFVVIAGNIYDPRATLGPLQNAPDDVIMRGRPVEFLLQAPAIDNVAHQIHHLAVDAVEEIDQHVGIAAARAQMDI